VRVLEEIEIRQLGGSRDRARMREDAKSVKDGNGRAFGRSPTLTRDEG
jgi:hypothetical protein